MFDSYSSDIPPELNARGSNSSAPSAVRIGTVAHLKLELCSRACAVRSDQLSTRVSYAASPFFGHVGSAPDRDRILQMGELRSVPRAAVSRCSNRSATFQRHFKPNDASGAFHACLQLRSPRSSPNRSPRAIDSNPNAVGSLATVVDDWSLRAEYLFSPSLDHHDQRPQFRSKGWRRSREKTQRRRHSAQGYARDEISPINCHVAVPSRCSVRCLLERRGPKC